MFGKASWRESIFRRELPLILEAIRYGDRQFFIVNPELDRASIYVHFQSSDPNYRKIDQFGVLSNYR